MYGKHRYAYQVSPELDMYMNDAARAGAEKLLNVAQEELGSTELSPDAWTEKMLETARSIHLKDGLKTFLEQLA